jgi:hypothetical protein
MANQYYWSTSWVSNEGADMAPGDAQSFQSEAQEESQHFLRGRDFGETHLRIGRPWLFLLLLYDRKSTIPAATNRSSISLRCSPGVLHWRSFRRARWFPVAMPYNAEVVVGKKSGKCETIRSPHALSTVRF